MTLLWKPLLAVSVPMDEETGDFDWSVVPFPVYASVKMDGYRAMVQRGVLLSRNGLPVANKELQARYGRKHFEGLDGELCDGPSNAAGVFHRTSRVVRKADADADDTSLYAIGFHSGYEDTFKDRVKILNESFKGFEKDCGVHIVKQTLLKSLDALVTYEVKAVTQGWEGVMLVRADLGPYPEKDAKENRSTLKEFWLARLKRFEYEEAVIVGVHPLEHNTNEERTSTGKRVTKKAGRIVDATRVGSATLKDVKTGVEFNTTIGAERLRIWDGWPSAIGKKVRYRYQVCGTLDKPRINSCTFEELGV